MTAQTPKLPQGTRIPWAVPLWIGVGLILLATAIGAVLYWAGATPFVIDAAWNSLLLSWDSDVLLGFSLFMDFVGGGWFSVFAVPIGVAVVLLIFKKPWSAVFFVAAELFSALLVQILKNLFSRARPEEILVFSDHGSYPSGHVANAATIAAAFVILFPRLWVVIVGAAWVLLMAFSRTYLHAHWLTDTFGGAMVGVGAALVVASLMSKLLEREVHVPPESPLAPGEHTPAVS
jgi:membrane-associated phospholipid phosphatase